MVIIISGHQDIASGGNFELATFSQMSADNFIILSGRQVIGMVKKIGK